MKIKFIKEPRNIDATGWDQTRDTTKIEIECEYECLSDVVSTFQDFLRACGYHFDGELDFVKDDEEN